MQILSDMFGVFYSGAGEIRIFLKEAFSELKEFSNVTLLVPEAMTL